MNKRVTYLIGTVLLLGFAGFAFASFRTSLVQYLPYDQAMAATRTVQVAGGYEHGSSEYDETEEALFFTIRDPETEETLRVRYHGVKPANFEEAISVVAIGRYDGQSDEFEAEKLLVKCPSKYQGAEVEKTYG